MTVTISDLQLAYDDAMNNPLYQLEINSKEKARQLYNNQQVFLDDCGESKTICDKCGQRWECLKRVVR